MNLSLSRSDVCRLMRACTVMDFAFEESGQPDTSQYLRLHDELKKQIDAFDLRQKQRKEMK